MSKQEELEQKVRESGSLEERLESCRVRIAAMCREGRPPKMTIPVHWDDDDFFISTTIKDAQQSLHSDAGESTDLQAVPNASSESTSQAVV